MVRVKRYSINEKMEWDGFNRHSKNFLFMFDRDYMDYHNDRFFDHSLMFYNEDTLVAILPACEKNGCLFSHAGLTFGGFITNEKMKQHTMNECFDTLIKYAQEQGWNEIYYKAIPHIYHSQPAEEDWYALYSHAAQLITVDAATFINLRNPLKMTKGRKAQISRAKREGTEIEILTSQAAFDEFIQLENEVLVSRHNTHAVHTSQELKLLHDRFPDNIHLYGAIKNHDLIAGVVIYEYDQVIHTQYMAANETARRIGALDLTVYSIIEKYKDNKLWLDFGISTEHGRIYLNEGLISQKEGFGGRTGVYSIWRIQLLNSR